MKAIVFDLDGVLVDACEWHYEALNRALEENLLKPIGRDDHIKVYNGLPTKKKLELMGLDEETKNRVVYDKKRFTKEIIAEKCRPNLNKIEMLFSLKHYKLACCSNAIKESVEQMLKKSYLYDYFDLVMGNDEGFAPKPAPDIYLEAAKRLGVDIKDCLIVEDAPHGIEAAKASGAMVLAVRGYEDVNIDLFRRLGCLI